jgi:competence protein ComEC
VEGRTVSRVEAGRTVPFRVEEGLPEDCRETVRLLVPTDADAPAAGRRIRLAVRWEARGAPPGGRAEWAGRLRPVGEPEIAPGGSLPGRLLRARGAIQEEIARLWGERAPMVEALVLARREHLDPGLREAFAHSGTAHLLAISGFHVGVVAGLFLGLLRFVGLGPRRAAAGAAAGCWLYVLGIGAPHAAVRAALLLTLLAAARTRGRPVVPSGALASALLLLLAADPRNLGSVGFQLSFAGTGGLVLLRGPLGDLVDEGWRRWKGHPLVRGRKTRGPGEGLLKGGADGLVAGTAATIPTLPLLAWHFDRVSLIGIPATLAVAPAVAAAIPGVGVSLLLGLLPGRLDAFLAGGVGLLLAGVEWGVRWCAELPGAALWVSRRALFVSAPVPLPVVLLLRRRFPGRVRPRLRWGAASSAGAAALLLVPLLPGPGVLELHLIDVGQGDAVALRLPSDRWIVVDAGPRDARFDAGARRVVPYLRRHGVRRVEALVLSHPHLDHVGGAPAVLDDLEVRGILDPSRPVPSRSWHETLLEGRARGVSWWRAQAGTGISVDGVRIEILHPDPPTLLDPGLTDWNDLSVVLLVRYGEGAILLTGDAGVAIEEAVLPGLPRLTVLKAGHHGSRTSSGAALLDQARPRKVVVPVGEANRYGHPHPEVMARFVERGIPVYRSDRDGDIRIRVHRDGSATVRTSR